MWNSHHTLTTHSPIALSPPAPQQYLTKKYLKKFQLRDYLHVIASDRDRQAYEVKHTHTPPLDRGCGTHNTHTRACMQLKYFKIGDDAADDN